MFRTLARHCLLVPALLVATLATSTVLLGQHAPVVAAGEWVRLWTPDAIRGTVIGATADTIFLASITATRATHLAVPVESIEKFERHVTAGSYVWLGARLGVLAGLGGAAIVATTCDGIFSYSYCFKLGSLFLAPTGGLLGALIGAGTPRASWLEVSLPERAGILLDPRGDVAVVLSRPF